MNEPTAETPPEQVITRCRWQAGFLPSDEEFELLAVPGGYRLVGRVEVGRGGRPASAAQEIEYAVEVDDRFRTRRAEILVDGRRLHLAASPAGLGGKPGGGWTLDGRPAPELDGATDIDLGFSPSTNTLPIRRLDLEVGSERAIAAAWVQWPSLETVLAEQTYGRLAERRWRYTSGSFTAELEVDAHGVVEVYGAEGAWHRVPREGDAP